jgi:UDP-glucose 4-epimerase
VRSKTLRVLVTGGLGYLGQHVVPTLQRFYDCEVTVLDSLLHAKILDSRTVGAPDYSLLIGDVRDQDSVAAAVVSMDRIVHLAAIVGEAACNVNASFSASVNIGGLEVVLATAAQAEVPLLFASSCSIFGRGGAQYLSSEVELPTLLPPYGHHKAVSESIISSSGWPLVWVARLASLYGASKRHRTDLVVNHMCVDARTAGRVRVHGSGSQRRPLIHVADAANILSNLIVNGTPPSAPRIVGVGRSEQNFTITELAQIVADRSGCEIDHVGYANVGDARSYSVEFVDDPLIPSPAKHWSLEAAIDEMLNDEFHSTAAYYDNNEVSVQRLFGVPPPARWQPNPSS